MYASTDKTTQKRSRRGKSNTLKSQIIQMATAYHNSQNEARALLHQNIYSKSLTAAITQGTTNESRQGDAIYMCSLKIRGSIFSHTTAGAYQYRILVGYSPEQIGFISLVSNGAGGLNNTDIFLDASSGPATSWIINPKAFTVIYDKVVDINSQIADVKDVNHFCDDIPLETKFAYQSEGSTFGSKRQLFLVVIGCVADGVANTTNNGLIQVNTDLVFKNL